MGPIGSRRSGRPASARWREPPSAPGVGPRAVALAAVAGAAGLGAAEAVARARQRPGQIPALWQRIAVAPRGRTVRVDGRG